MLESRNLVCYLPRLKPLPVLELLLDRALKVGLAIKMCKRSDFTLTLRPRFFWDHYLGSFLC